jgi:hypothetical protein
VLLSRSIEKVGCHVPFTKNSRVKAMTVQLEYRFDVAENRGDTSFESSPPSIEVGLDISKGKVEVRAQEHDRGNEEKSSPSGSGKNSEKGRKRRNSLVSHATNSKSISLQRTDNGIAHRDWDLDCCTRMSKRARYFMAKASRVDEEIRCAAL